MIRKNRFGLLVVALVSMAPASFAQGSLGLTPSQSADAFRAQVGNRLTFVCPAGNGANATVYGTDTYTTDSAVCAAAIHAGVLEPGLVGIISIVIGTGAPSFAGSSRHGVTTRNYGAWPYSYTFARDTAAGRISWKTGWTQIPAGFASPVVVECPAGGKPDAAIWGTDVYTRDSAICVAAVHAGVISADRGGLVEVSRANAREFVASQRFGIASLRWSASPDAFTVRRAAAQASESPAVQTNAAVARVAPARTAIAPAGTGTPIPPPTAPVDQTAVPSRPDRADIAGRSTFSLPPRREIQVAALTATGWASVRNIAVPGFVATGFTSTKHIALGTWTATGPPFNLKRKIQ